MAKQRNSKQPVLEAKYNELLEEARKNIRRAVGDYHFKTLIISALDGAVKHTWSEDRSPVKVTHRNRFPHIGKLTPDFMFEFSNGYRIVGEYKKVWQASPKDVGDLRQLQSYRNLLINHGDKVNQDRTGDLLLLISPGQDEGVCEAIAADPELGAGSVVVAEAHLEGQRMNGDVVTFAYRRFGGMNGHFLPVNAGPADTKYDLNHHFVKERRFIARCDVDALIEAGECPFINDVPPAPYTLINVLLRILNEKLTEAERDALATNDSVVVAISVDEVLVCPPESRPRITRDSASR